MGEEKENKITTLEMVSNSPCARLIASELAFTRLARTYDRPHEAWTNGEVLAATVAVVRRLGDSGYQIIKQGTNGNELEIANDDLKNKAAKLVMSVFDKVNSGEMEAHNPIVDYARDLECYMNQSQLSELGDPNSNPSNPQQLEFSHS